ncbi:MAG: ATP-binding protein [Candidatus Omnitrophica bacterium]|nr:ATP-binding protein [Candidatus Omnitrophota bacterium]
MITRNLTSLLSQSKRSLLLLGPRQTGKSTLIRSLQPELAINLVDESTYLAFASNPREIYERLQAQPFRTVFLDEIQRLPSLLNTLQAILDEDHFKVQFYLTGSSARKLRRGNANLLPGRLHNYFLGPLVASELEYHLDTKKALALGTLPGIWTETDQQEAEKSLRSYAATYLKEEIQAEALTRNVEGFSRFLLVAAAEAAKFIDLSKLASQASLPRQSAVRYFEILEDTLVIRRCEAFRKSLRRRLVQSPKFYFFDTGVLNGLLENFVVSADRIGVLFEHLVFNQIMDSAQSRDKQIRISSYRTEHGAEVDFVVEIEGRLFTVEAKATSHVSRADLGGFKSFAEYVGKKHEPILVYLGTEKKWIEGIRILPWQEFLHELNL